MRSPSARVRRLTTVGADSEGRAPSLELTPFGRVDEVGAEECRIDVDEIPQLRR
jgi:hypothetical protein